MINYIFFRSFRKNNVTFVLGQDDIFYSDEEVEEEEEEGEIVEDNITGKK